jgi:hypothetical protein
MPRSGACRSLAGWLSCSVIAKGEAGGRTSRVETSHACVGVERSTRNAAAEDRDTTKCREKRRTSPQACHQRCGTRTGSGPAFRNTSRCSRAKLGSVKTQTAVPSRALSDCSDRCHCCSSAQSQCCPHPSESGAGQARPVTRCPVSTENGYRTESDPRAKVQLR